MAGPHHFGRLNLTAIFFLFLSLLSIASAAPLLEDKVERSLGARNQVPITEDQYVAYLLKYFPATDHYLEYSGKSEDQVKAFKAKNPGYYYYDDLFNAPDGNHPWYKAFNPDTQIDDGEASSRAMSRVATKQILVFGAIEYATAGKTSFYALQEAPINKDGVKTGRLASINHMIKGATSPTEILAKEDANGHLTWQPGHAVGTKNASGSFDTCTKRSGTCDGPTIKPKCKAKKNCK